MHNDSLIFGSKVLNFQPVYPMLDPLGVAKSGSTDRQDRHLDRHTDIRANAQNSPTKLQHVTCRDPTFWWHQIKWFQSVNPQFQWPTSQDLTNKGIPVVGRLPLIFADEITSCYVWFISPVNDLRILNYSNIFNS